MPLSSLNECAILENIMEEVSINWTGPVWLSPSSCLFVWYLPFCRWTQVWWESICIQEYTPVWTSCIGIWDWMWASCRTSTRSDWPRNQAWALKLTFSVLAKFRPKDTNLQRLHYQTSTNLGLIQSNMTYLHRKRGVDYHWALDLYRRMGIPELEGMRDLVSNIHV